MLTSGRVDYKIDYCPPHDYATFVDAVKFRKSVQRVCYLGIENIRMFLSVERGTPVLNFYVKNDCSWSASPRKIRMRSLDLFSMLHSISEFERELREAFYFAYPRAEESFYDTLPTSKDVLARLSVQPDQNKMHELRLLYMVDNNVVDDDDGIVTITCDDGDLCVPYDDVDGLVVLQMERAKFHPDNIFITFFDRVFDWFYGLWLKISTFSVGSVLGRIDKIVK